MPAIEKVLRERGDRRSVADRRARLIGCADELLASHASDVSDPHALVEQGTDILQDRQVLCRVTAMAIFEAYRFEERMAAFPDADDRCREPGQLSEPANREGVCTR